MFYGINSGLIQDSVQNVLGLSTKLIEIGTEIIPISQTIYVV
jgi:hypothetical protein